MVSVEKFDHDWKEMPEYMVRGTYEIITMKMSQLVNDELDDTPYFDYLEEKAEEIEELLGLPTYQFFAPPVFGFDGKVFDNLDDAIETLQRYATLVRQLENDDFCLYVDIDGYTECYFNAEPDYETGKITLHLEW